MQKFVITNNTTKLSFKQEWDNGICIEELRTNLLKKVNARWNEKLAANKNFIENESFEDRWEKGMPAEKVLDRLEKKVRDLWQK